MRNIFQACYNAYRPNDEPTLSDQAALQKMKFSPRLFEIKLHHRMENVAYIEDANLFVVTEGEASRCLNFNTGTYMSPLISYLAEREFMFEYIAFKILHCNECIFRHGYQPWDSWYSVTGPFHSFGGNG